MKNASQRSSTRRAWRATSWSCRSSGPAWPRCAGCVPTGRWASWPHAIGNLAALDAEFLAGDTGQVSGPLLRRAHAAGKEVYVWTVDDPRAMSRIMSMGVDGLITNLPATARQVMEVRADLSLAERLLVWLSDRFRLDSFDPVAEPSEA